MGQQRGSASTTPPQPQGSGSLAERLFGVNTSPAERSRRTRRERRHQRQPQRHQRQPQRRQRQPQRHQHRRNQSSAHRAKALRLRRLSEERAVCCLASSNFGLSAPASSAILALTDPTPSHQRNMPWRQRAPEGAEDVKHVAENRPAKENNKLKNTMLPRSP